MNIEENIKLLEKYIKDIEDESTSLEDALKTFETAIEITKQSLESITSQRGKFEELSKDLDKILTDDNND